MATIQPMSQVGHKSSDRNVGRQYQSILIMTLISVFLLGGIGSRLAYLQIIEGKRNQELADNNRIRIIPKQPVRGNIFDRKGQILASSRLSHAVFLWPLRKKQEEWPETIQLLSQLLEIPEQEIREPLEQTGYNPLTRVRVARSLTPTQITALEEYSSELQGVEVDIEAVRNYPHKEAAAHVLGYTGELNAQELEQRRNEGYRLGDIIGKMGVESTFESHLRGTWGGKQVEVDSAGRVLNTLGEKQAKSGKNLTLTLDLELQKAAEAALGQRKGSIVALHPNTGEVLALVSYPTFDPNIFSARVTPEIWRELQRTKPFVNRAIRGFPPASTFKVVTATAGMESGKYPSSTVLGTFPYLSVGGTRFHEWNRAGFGPMGYVRALAWSSNTFFGQIGKGVTGPTLIDWSRRYGFGERSGVELDSESAGLIADDTWKQERFNWEWTVGDTVNMSIGQGFTQATPLQVAVMFAVPANGGYRVKPHLLQDERAENQWRTSLNLKPETIKTLRSGLRQVVANGTGGALNSSLVPPSAGKSGTAEAPPGKPHAWFGAFAPYDQPEIVVVAFAEHSGGGGGSVAAPMVRQVLEAYFQGKKKSIALGNREQGTGNR